MKFKAPWKADNTFESEDQYKENKTAKPWLITRVQNGLKAVNGEPTLMRFAVNKKIPVKYYEYDRIYGRGAFASAGILKVNDLFGELQDVTPYTEYFIFEESNYHTRDDGILVKNRNTKQECFYSNETLTNQNVAVYFNLDQPSKPSTHGSIDESDSDREALHIETPELKEIESNREL